VGSTKATSIAANGREEPPRVPANLVRAELERILHSPPFRGSHRSQDFLRYVVEKALASQFAELKERHIAVDLFGRPADANLAEDTIVRVSAREVRRRLEQYYSSPEGAAAEWQIHLPPGSYVPEFRHSERRAEPPPAPEPTNSASSPVKAAWSPGMLRRRWWLLPVMAVLALAAFAAWRRTAASPEESASRQFWQPLLSAGEEVLIGVPHPIVFHPSVRATRESAKRLPPQEIPLQRSLALRPDELTGSDFVEVRDQYVAFGDLIAASNLQAFFALEGKRVKLRLASKVDLADLKETPSVQIGAYTNRWTLELSRNARFRFRYTEDGRACIVDTTSPGKQWALPVLTSDGTSDLDYLLITRLLAGSSGQPAILVAGLKQFGTGAGGQLLTDPQQLGQILRGIQDGRWRASNLQMVLEMRVIGNTPSPPHLVAWHVW